MAPVPSPLITSAGLVGGYLVARETKRALGGAVFAAAGAAAFETWRRQAGLGTAAALTGAYLDAFGLSHPLAKKGRGVAVGPGRHRRDRYRRLRPGGPALVGNVPRPPVTRRPGGRTVVLQSRGNDAAHRG